MQKSICRMLIFIIISFLVIKIINYIISCFYFQSILISDVLKTGVYITWIVITLLQWFLFGNILKYNIMINERLNQKIIFYIVLNICIGAIISLVNILGYYSGYNPIYDNQILFSMFIGFENDWYGPIKHLVIFILGETFSAVSYTLLSVILMDVIILAGVLLGARANQLVKRSF